MENSGTSFYVYILQSLKDFSFYMGQCENHGCRMSKHFDSMSKYTTSKRPLRLVYLRYNQIVQQQTKGKRKLSSKKAGGSRNLIDILMKYLISCYFAAFVVFTNMKLAD